MDYKIRNQMEKEVYECFIELHGNSVKDDREYEWEQERISCLTDSELQAEWTESKGE